MVCIKGDLANPRFKAFTLDTPLLTASGWTTTEHVQIGDELIGRDGTPTPVVGVTEQSTYRTCHRFTYDDGTHVVAHSGNVWLAINAGRRIRFRSGVEDWRERWDLAESVNGHEIAQRAHVGAGKASNFSIPLAMPVELPDADLPLPPYVLGAWLGDGCKDSATMTTCDPWMLDEFRQQGMAVTSRAHRTKDRSIDFGFRVDDGRGQVPCSHGTGKALLRAAGVLGGKFVPRAYLNGSPRQRLALLRGLMDTDGYRVKNGAVAIEQRDEVIAAGVVELARSLGWRAHLNQHQRPHPPRSRETNRFWHVKFRPDLCPFSMPRKADQWHRDLRWDRRFTHRTLVQVDEGPRKRVRGIEVASADGSFLVGRGLIPI